MSEYQYYEFRALDRPLSAKQMDELGKLSSRAEITSTSMVNEYHYGNFRGDPGKLMQTYFDAFVYVANWGTHTLMLRLPAELFDIKSAQPYLAHNGFQAKQAGEFVVLEFDNDEEGGGWEEGGGYMDDLLPLRAELMAGDLRPLYLAWLSGVQSGELEDDAVEPPRPPGLSQLTAAQTALADFLDVPEDLLSIAAANDPGAPSMEPPEAQYGRWVAGLSRADADAWLVRFLTEESPLLRVKFARQFQSRSVPAPMVAGARLTVGKFLAGLEQEETKRQQAKADLAAAACKQALKQLKQHEAENWKEAERLSAGKGQTEYAAAAQLLKGLLDLARSENREAEAVARIANLRRLYSRKSLFKRVLDQAGLP